MAMYECVIRWDVDAASPREAAEIMWQYVRESEGPIVEVSTSVDGHWEDVDLYQEAG